MPSLLRAAAKQVGALKGLRGIAHLTSAQLLVVAPGLLALGICTYQLTLPHTLTGVHDSQDGVDLAPALLLVHGVFPYRDYAFVHPPGIAWLMSPLGLLGSTRDAMVAARIATALVAGLNASLAAFAVRAYGRVAMLSAGLALAIFPTAVTADHTVSLDPYLVLFCLLGTVTMFSGGGLAMPRRVMIAGALFGFAAATKTWAIFPVIAALSVCVPLWKSALRPFVSGLVLGFGALTLPFLLLAPRNFVHDVVLAQFGRGATQQGFHSFGQRLALMLGFTPSNIDTKAHLAPMIGLGFAALVIAVYFVPARKCTRFEWFLLGAAAIVAATLLLAKDFYTYYAYFAAAFGVMLLGACLGRFADGIRWAAQWIGGSRGRAITLVASVGYVALVVVVVALTVPLTVSYARSYLSLAYDPEATIAQHVPKGACVVFDGPGNLLDSNRFVSSRPGCPALVDPYGLWLTDNNGIAPPAQPPYSDAFVAKWRDWLERADYAVLTFPHSDYLPWTPSLISWFNGRYRLVASQPFAYVYEHIRA